MQRFLTTLAIIIVVTSCRDSSTVKSPETSIKFPTITIQEDSDDKSILIATVTNPSSSELSIPGFESDMIYGSYWYRGDKVINAPECATGFWNSVIKIPAGQIRDLRLPLPPAVTRGERYTVVVVYSGMGASSVDYDHKRLSSEEWIRNPDISLNCRKMETEVNLATE